MRVGSQRTDEATGDRADETSWLRRRTAGLDARYWRLLGAVASSNLGDGFASLAFPWLASLLTRDPLAIAGVGLATRLPWLVFSLQAGVLSDISDRRRLMVIANALRTVVAAGTAAAVLFDVASLPLLYVAAFLLGMCEVVFDNTSQAILPAIVSRDRLERANGNLMGAQMVIDDFIARPLAGAVIGLSLSLPFAIDAATAAVSAALVFSIPGTFRASAVTGEASVTPRPRMRTQIAEGLRWLWRHRLLRRLAVALGAMNGTSAMMMATFVLFAQEILQLDGFGFGLLLASGSVGGVLGSAFAPNLVKLVGSGPSLTSTIVVPIAGFLVLTFTSNPVLVGAAFALYTFTAIMWNVVTVTLRQTLIPDHLLGRVNSVYRFLGWGAMPIGTLLGGVLVRVVEDASTRDAGLRSPFVFALVMHVVLAITVAPRLRTHHLEEAKAAAAD